MLLKDQGFLIVDLLKLCGRFLCLGVTVSAGFMVNPVAVAQDTDVLALPTRKGAASESAEKQMAEESGASEKTSAITRLSKASGHGNTYIAPLIERKNEPEPVRKETVSSTKRDSESEKSSSSKNTDNSSRQSDASAKSSKSVASTKPTKSDSKSESRQSDTGKSSEKKSESAKSEPKKSGESASGDADLAAVESLQETSGDGEVAEANSESDPALEAEADQALATEMASVPMPAVAPAPAPVPYAPNVYLPQAPEKRGLLSRIFNRKQDPQLGTAATRQSAFSSDYATRGNAILPAVLDGAGYNGQDLPIGGEDPYRFASLPSTFRPTDLVQIPIANCHYGNQLYLRREAANSLCSMIYDAACQGLNIRVVSAYRDYGHQMRLYTRAVARGGENQKSVARPGKSEHHLGTTVDLTNSEQHTLKRSFGDTPEGQWLAANAHRYGWKMTVMSGNGRRSHNDEPWHLRYLGSAVNSNTSQYAVANTNSQSQSSGIVGSVKRLFGLGRR